MSLTKRGTTARRAEIEAAMVKLQLEISQTTEKKKLQQLHNKFKKLLDELDTYYND